MPRPIKAAKRALPRTPTKRVAPKTAKPRKTGQTKAPTAASHKAAEKAKKQQAYNATMRSTVAKPKPASGGGSIAMPPKRDAKGPGGHIGNAHQSFFDIGNFLKSLGK